MLEMNEAPKSPLHGKFFIANRRPRRIEAIHVSNENIPEVVAFVEGHGGTAEYPTDNRFASIIVNSPSSSEQLFVYTQYFLAHDGTAFFLMKESELDADYDLAYVKPD